MTPCYPQSYTLINQVIQKLSPTFTLVNANLSLVHFTEHANLIFNGDRKWNRIERKGKTERSTARPVSGRGRWDTRGLRMTVFVKTIRSPLEGWRTWSPLQIWRDHEESARRSKASENNAGTAKRLKVAWETCQAGWIPESRGNQGS